MFEQMFMPWLLFLSAGYMIFVLFWVDTGGGHFIPKLMWKIVPTVLMLALFLAWLMEMGFVLPPTN